MLGISDGPATDRDNKVAASGETSYDFDGVVGDLMILRTTQHRGSDLFGNDPLGFGHIFNRRHSILLWEV